MILPRQFLIIVILCLDFIAKAQVTYTDTTLADAFLATGSAGNPAGADLMGLNYGNAGTLVVAPATSIKGEFQSVLKFNFSNALTLFNGSYGAGHWTITGITLQLTSNYGTNGAQPMNAIFPKINTGKFVIEWLSNDAWVEGTGTPNLPTTDGATYDSLPGLLSGTHEKISTNLYVPPGNNVPVTYALPLNANLVADVSAGSDTTFLFYAADDQIGYLFNSHNFGNGNEPLIHITAIPVLKILSGNFSNGFFHLVGIGGTNAPYQIQASADLSTTNWQTLGTANADSDGMIQFDDFAATNHNQRYYRLAQ